MSLLEMTIAAGIAVTIAFGVSGVMFEGGKGARGVAMTGEFESLMANVQQTISIEANCRGFIQSQVGNLPGAFPVELNEVSFPNPPGPPVVVLRKLLPGQAAQGLTIRRIALTGIQTGLGVLVDGNRADIISMQVEAERLTGANNSKAIGVEKLVKTFTFTVVSAPVGGAILNCYKDPGVLDICTAIGGIKNVNGVVCDIGPEVCRQLGGVYNAAAVPPCDYSVVVNPPTNITERVCIDMGGIYTGGVPACQFGANSDFGATSITASCTSLGGTLVPGPPPARCNFCAAHGGEWNAAIGAAGGCDFARKPCEGRSRPGFPAVYDPATRTCDTVAANCNRMGGVLNGGRCSIPLQRQNCTGPHTIGRIYPGAGDFWSAYPWSCPNGMYVNDISGTSTREENDDRDGFRIQYTCCRNAP